MLIFPVLFYFPQTHTKVSKKGHPSQAIRSSEDNLVAIEPPAYGTSNAVFNFHP